MRSEQEVQDRVRHLLTQEINLRAKAACARLPHLCKHNRRHPLDVRKSVEGERNQQYNQLSGRHLPVIGLCMLGAESPTTWPGNICEDPIDAQQCPFFDRIETKEAAVERVQAEFYQQIRDLQWVQDHMPEVAGLLWALDSKDLPGLPWWQTLVFRWLQVRPDTLVVRRPWWKRFFTRKLPELPTGD